MLPSEAELDRALIAKGGLIDFVEMAWPIVEPSAFVPNWHLDEICLHLEAVSDLRIRRLVINQPPSTGKSIITGVFWPVWEWIFRPQTKWFFASYDQTLVGTRDASKVVRLLQSDWYRERWGTLLNRQSPALSNFDNIAGGYRFATGTHGKGTGRHCDIQVIDDPMRPKDASGGGAISRNELKFVSEWYSGTMSSRAVDPPTFRRVIVMQRLHEEDLAGEQIETGKYQHLCLPMLFDPDRHSKTLVGGDRRTERDELLFPARFPLDAVQTIKEEMGPDVFAAQEQQIPTRKGGATFLREWWRFWHTKPGVKDDFCPVHAFDRCDCPAKSDRLCEVLPSHGLDLQSWDFAFQGKDNNDFVAGGVFRSVGKSIYLLDCMNERLSFVQSQAAIITLSKRFPRAYDKLIEKAANGSAVEDSLKVEINGLTLIPPVGSKEARAHACTPLIAAGHYYLPHPSIAPWVPRYMKQLEAYPNAANDDMVDMTSQAINKLRQFGNTFAEAMKKFRGE